jgi:hypothetical protein
MVVLVLGPKGRGTVHLFKLVLYSFLVHVNWFQQSWSANKHSLVMAGFGRPTVVYPLKEKSAWIAQRGAGVILRGF